MPDPAPGSGALIGPNAVLQLVHVLNERCDPDLVTALLTRAGLDVLPDGSKMIPEGDAASLHQVVQADAGLDAPEILAEAGRRTADYILAHRIPRFAQIVLTAMPPAWAAQSLSRAIERHAWTFVGSGRFRVIDPWLFEIHDNPVIGSLTSKIPLCHWHAAVFERLYAKLVHRHCRCVETRCCADGRGPCRFLMSIVQDQPA